MPELECQGCRELQRRVAELEAVVRELRARLGINASNSSLPPSANPLGAAKPVVKKRSKRKRGGQRGHPPHLKQLLPPERVTRTVPFVPEACEHCQAALSAEAGPNDPEPTRHQVVEVPPIVTDVTEYQGHARTCGCCGHVTRAVIPAAVRAHSIGPRFSATLSFLTGHLGCSKRAVEEFAETVYVTPIALGTVIALEQEMSAALAPAHQEAVAAVRQAAVKNADETGWKLQGKPHWLWAAATATVAAFVLHARRSAAGLTALLGEGIVGIVGSDRWGPYGRLPEAQRQLCWAHLKRDFQKIVDRDDPKADIGRRGLRLVRQTFRLWHQFRDGGVSRAELQRRLQPVQFRMNRLLIEGAWDDDGPVATFCANVHQVEDALWTFTRVAGVEPTNNHIERLLRRGVLWRKRSFGCNSAAGCRFVERILTVVQTLRLQNRQVLDYLHATLQAHRAGQAGPTLIVSG